MKSIGVTWLAAGSLLACGSPGAATSLEAHGFADVRSGAFAGARLRLPLSGGRTAAKPRFALTVAPMLRAQGADGRVGMRFGEGVAFGVAGGRGPRLTAGGHTLATFGPQGSKPDDKDASGVSKLGGVALVSAGVLLGIGIVYVALLNADDNSD